MDATVVLGREVELAAGERFLDHLSEPELAACVIVGDGGIGKTTVFRAITGSAASRGMRVLAARPAEAETAVSYAGLGDLLDGVDPSEMTHLPAPQRLALEVACLRREPLLPVADLRPIATAFAGLLRHLAARTPVLIAIDDVGWLDGPTRRSLAFAVRRLPGSRVGVLLAQRGQSPASVSLELDGVPWERRVSLVVGPLDPHALSDLMQRRLAMRLTRWQSLRLHTLTGGNPFLASEVARTLMEGSTDGVAVSGGRPWDDLGTLIDVERVARDRLDDVHPRSRRVLAAAAALAIARLDVLGRAFGSQQGVRQDLGAAISHGIVTVDADVVHFQHPLLAAAAYSTLPAAERRAVHRRLAKVVTDVEARARHLAMAEVAPDEDIADELDAGALRAAARGAPDAAAELALAALRLSASHPAPSRQVRTATAAGYLAQAGDLGRAREMYLSLIAELEEGPHRAVILRRLAEVRMRDDDFQGAIPLLTQADHEVGDDPEARVAIALNLTFAHTNQLELAEARRHSLVAVREAERVGAPPLSAVTLAIEQMTRFLTGGGVDVTAFDRALEFGGTGGPFPVVLWPALVVGLLCSWIGANLRARALLADVVREAEALGDEPSLPAALMYTAENELILGDVVAAEAAAARAVDISEQVGSDVLLALSLTARARVGALQGRAETARADASRAADLFAKVGWRSNYLSPPGVLGSLAWSLGDARSTVQLLGPLRDQMREAGMHDPATMPFLGDLIEAMLALGRHDDAEAIISQMDERGRALGRPWALAIAARGRALQLAGRGQVLPALAAVQEAAALHAMIDPSPFDVARTCLIRGRIERRAKRRAASRRSLELALASFSGLGATLWAERTRQELARVGPGPRSELLTDTERRVAELAAQGLTNREVADQAFLAAKSVEGVLSRAYDKLGIRSRAELGAWYARQKGPVERDEPASEAVPDRAGATI